jgi:hypothetical protein
MGLAYPDSDTFSFLNNACRAFAIELQIPAKGKD